LNRPRIGNMHHRTKSPSGAIVQQVGDCQLVKDNAPLSSISEVYVKADSHIPCRSAIGLDCLSHLIYTMRPCLIHSCHAVTLSCHKYAVLKATSQGHGRVAAGERHGMCELASTVQIRHVGDLPAFGTFGEWQGSGRIATGERHGNL
jgi:hypothetical protein